MDQRRDHLKMNFEYFQIQKWTLQTVRSEIVDEKSGVICLVSMFPSWGMVQIKAICKLKQFTYMHLKDLVTYFQKMALFIMLWRTVSEILVFEIEKFC